MIKKIIAIILLEILSFSSTFAYTQTELEAKKTTYKKVIKTKIGSKLEKISEAKLKKILVLIDKFVEKYENNKTISDNKKLNKISLLLAFKEVINEKLDEFSDINSILNEVNKKIEVIMITDKRCSNPECNVEPIINQLRQIGKLKEANFNILDFSEKEAKEILKKNGITKLPAAIFTENTVVELKAYLEKTESGKYSLQLGATFDPYVKMSAKGFKILDKKIIEKIKNSSYIKGNKNSKILYLEYSDMECPFCAKLHNTGTLTDLEKKYGIKISYSFQHFPLGFHKNALPAAEAMECVAQQKGVKTFYDLEKIVFKNKNSNLDSIVDEAVKLGVDKTKLETCVKNKEFENKINSQQKQGTKLFGITGTPGNVLINTETGEYEVLMGAYPTNSFIEIIDKLLK